MASQTRPALEATDWRALHGVVIVLAFMPCAFLPDDLRVWPVPILLPLAVYALIVVCIRPLRQTCQWLAAGAPTREAVALTTLIVVVSSATLIGFQAMASPALDHLDRALPLDLLGRAAVTTVVFSLLNALLEEAVFRGILHQAIEARANWQAAVIATALLFGWGHLGGYPPGPAGAVLAGVYGLALGYVRHISGGLALPVVAHIFADATIMGIRLATAS